MNDWIIAVDFGTTYSGYAFSITPTGTETEPHIKKWSKELGLDTPKTPTCILFDEDKTFLKFGYDAKTVYMNMRGEEAKKKYFFENFKMALYGKKLGRDVEIKAANRKSMKALKVFTKALRYLKEDALKTIAESTECRKLTYNKPYNSKIMTDKTKKTDDCVCTNYHHLQKLSRDVEIKAANGKSVKALKVFTEALRYLKEDALKTISKNTAARKFIASDFTWVLTVPANWDSSAKQFMRESATQAGIVTERAQHNLIIALEPEAASVWCKKLPADGFITQNHDGSSLDQSPGTRYMVVDCGGGTIDITVHEVLDGGALKELHKASGNDLGGQTVDRKFKEFLREIFSHGVWDEYEENFPSEVQKIMNDFMYFKQEDDDVQMACPFNLGKLATERQEIEKFFESVRGASWDKGSIKIAKESLRSFFADSLKGITDGVREILNKDLNIECILLVGGYAESQILRHHVIDQFGDQHKVLCPYRPQEAIVKGAVEFGRNPAVVAFRNCAFTYGFADSEKFDLSKHEEEKKFVVQGEVFCRDIFRKLVKEGEDLGWDETRELVYNVLEANECHTNVRIRFYRTKTRNPLYVDEEGVEEVGSLTVRMPTTQGKKHVVKLNIRFGSTEITATGRGLAYGPKESAMIDFMVTY